MSEAPLLIAAGGIADASIVYWLARQTVERRKAIMRKLWRVILWLYVVQAALGVGAGLALPWLIRFNVVSF
jgi:hypothetical protein